MSRTCMFLSFYGQQGLFGNGKMKCSAERCVVFGVCYPLFCVWCVVCGVGCVYALCCERCELCGV